MLKLENPTEELKTFKEKKQWLSQVSKQIKPLCELGGLTVNQAILEAVYKGGNLEWNTFNTWKKKGFKVKKGEKAFPLWSSPQKGSSTKETDSEQEKEEYKFFGLVYLFNNQQVEQI